MVGAVQELPRLPTLHPVLILEAVVVGAVVEALQHQMLIQIHLATMDLLIVEHLLTPLHRLMEAVAEVVVLRRQMRSLSHMEAVMRDLVLQHRMRVPTLLEVAAVMQDLHLKPKAALTPITTEDLVAGRVSELHHLYADIITNIISSEIKPVENSTVSSASTAVEDLGQGEVELLEDNPELAAMLPVKQVDLIKDMYSMEEAISVVLMDSAEVLAAQIMDFLEVLIKEGAVALEVH
jgi:hypothetical protein